MQSPAEWQELQEGRYYVKRELYKLGWNFKIPALAAEEEMINFQFVGASFGGPIAVIPRERAQDLSEEKRFLTFYSSSGMLLTKLQWKHQGLVKSGWTNEERFVCVLSTGWIHMYDILGNPVKSFTIFPKEFSNERVADAVIYDNAVVCRTAYDRAFQMWLVPDLDDGIPMQLAETPLVHRPPASMTVIPPDFTLSKQVEVLLSTAEGSIVVVDRYKAQDQNVTEGPFIKMVVSPEGSNLACYNEKGFVTVRSTDFKKAALNCEVKMKSSSPLTDMQWCGKDAIMLYWDQSATNGIHLLVVLAPIGGGFFKYTFRSPIVLIPEIDGARIFNIDTCDYLEDVPKCCQDIFSIGSTHDASHLFTAFEAFQNKEADSDDYMREIQNMERAVNGCLDAATYVVDQEMQTTLLKAAAHGKLFCTGYQHYEFVETCKGLRCINALRDKEIGMCVTYRQFRLISDEAMINRLMQRRHHLLALSMCKYLDNLRNCGVLFSVLEHWAICKIEEADENLSTDELLEIIIGNLREYPGVSYAKIARSTNQFQPKLAINLLDYETKASETVECLLEFKQYETALEKALKSSDTDLVYRVIRSMVADVEHISENERNMVISARPLASDVFLNYCKDEREFDMIKYFLQHSGRLKQAGNICVESAFQTLNVSDPEETIRELKIARDLYNCDKTNLFKTEAVSEQITLLEFQSKHLPETTGYSVVATLRRLLEDEKEDLANDFRRLFKFTDKRFYLLKAAHLASLRKWSHLDNLARQFGNIIGWSALVDVSLNCGGESEAIKYAMRISDYGTKMERLVTLQAWDEAATASIEEKNKEGLDFVLRRCNNPALKQRIIQHLQKMR